MKKIRFISFIKKIQTDSREIIFNDKDLKRLDIDIPELEFELGEFPKIKGLYFLPYSAYKDYEIYANTFKAIKLINHNPIKSFGISKQHKYGLITDIEKNREKAISYIDNHIISLKEAIIDLNSKNKLLFDVKPNIERKNNKIRELSILKDKIVNAKEIILSNYHRRYYSYYISYTTLGYSKTNSFASTKVNLVFLEDTFLSKLHDPKKNIDLKLDDMECLHTNFLHDIYFK